jgi:hypothetical protein
MTTLEQIRHALSAASAVDDPTMRAVYTATARALVTRLRADLELLEGHVRAVEVELGRCSRDVTQLSLAESEGPIR